MRRRLCRLPADSHRFTHSVFLFRSLPLFLSLSLFLFLPPICHVHPVLCAPPGSLPHTTPLLLLLPPPSSLLPTPCSDLLPLMGERERESCAALASHSRADGVSRQNAGRLIVAVVGLLFVVLNVTYSAPSLCLYSPPWSTDTPLFLFAPPSASNRFQLVPVTQHSCCVCCSMASGTERERERERARARERGRERERGIERAWSQLT